jgi:IS4 transposase
LAGGAPGHQPPRVAGVELFVKQIKQHLRFKHFLGNSENAVKTQVWCAVATY